MPDFTKTGFFQKRLALKIFNFYLLFGSKILSTVFTVWHLNFRETINKTSNLAFLVPGFGIGPAWKPGNTGLDTRIPVPTVASCTPACGKPDLKRPQVTPSEVRSQLTQPCRGFSTPSSSSSSRGASSCDPHFFYYVTHLKKRVSGPLFWGGLATHNGLRTPDVPACLRLSPQPSFSFLRPCLFMEIWTQAAAAVAGHWTVQAVRGWGGWKRSSNLSKQSPTNVGIARGHTHSRWRH